MPGPLILGLVGGALVALAAFLTWVLIKPDRSRYQVGRTVGYNGDQPGLRQLVIDQGRLVLLGFVGSALQLVALIWQSTRAN